MSELETVVEVQKPGDAIFNKSFDIVKDAMKNVMQEMVITLEDDTAHIVYIHNIDFDQKDSNIIVDFSTLSENRKDDIYPHVVACIEAQIKDYQNTWKSTQKRKIFSFI